MQFCSAHPSCAALSTAARNGSSQPRPSGGAVGANGVATIRAMPRFTLRMLFVSTTLFAASVWLAMRATDRIHTLFNPGPAPYMLLVVAGAMFGAGLLAPFNVPSCGAIFGGMATVAYLYFPDRLGH